MLMKVKIDIYIFFKILKNNIIILNRQKKSCICQYRKKMKGITEEKEIE